MKTCLQILAAMVVGILSASASPAASEEIRQVIDKQQAAWNQGDLEAFMTGYWNSPDLTFFSGAHESKGWQAALDRYK